MNRYTEDREFNTQSYNWKRIAEESRVIEYCKSFGAVDLSSHAMKPMHNIEGFSRK